jgi:hypothetical protein
MRRLPGLRSPLLSLLFLAALCPVFSGVTLCADDFESDLIARRLFREGVARSESRPGAGVPLFEEIVARFGSSIWAGRARKWLEGNPIMSIATLVENGSSENRIDVAVMGDGFKDSYTDRKMFGRLSKDLLKHFFRGEVFKEYACCFNFHEVMLASREDRLDYRKHEYDTALDGRKLGDDRHVTVSRDRVHHYLEACEWNDGQAFALVREGGLGTGGGGVATVGKDLGTVVIHEFGHSFAGLADEYSRDTSPRGTPTRGPNVSESPDPRMAPWAHWHKRYPNKYKTHEGAAAVYKGVWRPTPDGCVMRAAHDFCPICREAIVLKIYSYVRPIDRMTPVADLIELVAGGEKKSIEVFPIVPKSHRLTVEWSVLAEGTPGFESSFPKQGHTPLPGKRIAGKRETVGKRPCHFVEIQDLLVRRKIGIGRHRIFARVVDPGKVRGDIWVLKDRNGVCTQTVSWYVTVTEAPPKPPPRCDFDLTVVTRLSHGRLGGFDCTQSIYNRPGEKMRFVPFDSGLGYGFPLGLPEAAVARNRSDRKVETKSSAGGVIEVAAEDVERFSFYWRRMATEDLLRAAGSGVPSLVVDSGALFVDPGPGVAGRVDVSFTLPPDWELAVPFIRQEECYRIDSRASMARNIICLGGWKVNEAQTEHVLLRTAISNRFETGGRALNTLFFRILTGVGREIGFPAGRIILVASDRGDTDWEVVRGADSLLFLIPVDYNPSRPDRGMENELLELAGAEFLSFFGPEPADVDAALFLGSAYSLMALRVVSESRYRNENWFDTRAAELLGGNMEKSRGLSARGDFALGFFLDRTLLRLAGEKKRLPLFIASLVNRRRGEGALTLEAILQDLSAFSGFDVTPMWERLTAMNGGPDTVAELRRAGLRIVRDKKDWALVETGSR